MIGSVPGEFHLTANYGRCKLAKSLSSNVHYRLRNALLFILLNNSDRFHQFFVDSILKKLNIVTCPSQL